MADNSGAHRSKLVESLAGWRLICDRDKRDRVFLIVDFTGSALYPHINQTRPILFALLLVVWMMFDSMF